MGAGASRNREYIRLDWEGLTSAEWRSFTAKELDKLGGPERPAIKKGKSMHYRLEWLEAQVKKQGDDIEQALAKDPIAGRHEIMKQELVKASRAAQSHKFSVREWQQMNHTELRAMQLREQQQKQLMKEQSKASMEDDKRPDWNPLHHVGDKSQMAQTKEKAANYRDRMREYYLNMADKRRKYQNKKVAQIADTYGINKLNGKLWPGWRVRVHKAKRTAWHTVGAAMRLQRVTQFKGPRPLARIDSLSYFLAQHLGDQLPRFVEEQTKHRQISKSIEQLQGLVEDMRKCRARTPATPEDAAPTPATACARAPHPPPSPAPKQSSSVSPSRTVSAAAALTSKLSPLSCTQSAPACSEPAASSDASSSSNSNLSTVPASPTANSLLRPRSGQPLTPSIHQSASQSPASPRGLHAPPNISLTPPRTPHESHVGRAKSPAHMLPTVRAVSMPADSLLSLLTDESAAVSARGQATPLNKAAPPAPQRPSTSSPPRQLLATRVHGTPGTPKASNRAVSPEPYIPNPTISSRRASSWAGPTKAQPNFSSPPPSMLQPTRPKRVSQPSSTPSSPNAAFRSTHGFIQNTAPLKGRGAAAGKEGRPGRGSTSKGAVINSDPSLEAEIDLIREQTLHKKLAEESAGLERPERMMLMYANRANARWLETEAQHLETAHVHDVSKFAIATGGGQAGIFKTEVLNYLKSGKIALQILAAEDYVLAPDGTASSLWSADPWALVQKYFPARADSVDRVEGVHLGPRLLMAMVGAVQALAGEAAAKQLQVIIHCNDKQAQQVVEDLWDRKFCGLQKENITLVIQKRRLGYTYDKEQEKFVAAPNSQSATAGSGYSMMQLAWREEAWSLGAERGQRDQLQECVLDWLQQKGAYWLLTRRLRDLSLYHPETTLDLDSLAYSLYLHDSNGANMLVQVDLIDNSRAARHFNGIVVARRQRSSGNPASNSPAPISSSSNDASNSAGSSQLIPSTSNASSVTSMSATASSASATASATPSTQSAAQPAIQMKAPRYLHHVMQHKDLPVLDIKMSDMQTPKMTQLLNDLKLRNKGRLPASTKRYMFHIASLKTIMSKTSIFHPSMDACGDVAYITFEMSDLTAAPGARCAALLTRQPTKVLSSHSDVDELVPAIQAQDASGTFRKLAGNATGAGKATMPARPSTAATAATTEGSELRAISGQHIVLLCVDNDATQLALQLAQSIVRPGKDCLHLVTVIQSFSAEPAARALLSKLQDLAGSTLVQTQTEVLVKSSAPLVDQLEEYCVSVDAGLVVMGSQALAVSNNAAAAVMGSVAITVLKSINKPLLIVKANAKNAAIQWDKDKLKAMVSVDHTSRPLLRYVCKSVLNALRMDRLYLGRGNGREVNSHQETMTSRRLLDNFTDISSSLHFDAIKRPLEGPFELSSVRVADVEKIHIVAVQAPVGRSIPEQVVALLKNTHSALLVFRSNDPGY